MNRKAFTLVELLSAIVILGVIVTIVYPTVISTIHSSEKKAFDNQVKTIEKAMKMYYLDHPEELKDLNDNGTMNGCSPNNSVNALKQPGSSVTISILINQGYISDNEIKNGKLINPCTDEELAGDIEVKWVCDKNQYEYKFTPTSTCD